MTILLNETNLTELLTRPNLQFNETEMVINMYNGTGKMTMGYVSANCRVQGFDILLELQIIQTVIQAIILILLVIYVYIYVARYLYE